ncbi:unnamed protein product [Ectocarpus fasciculatus]
MVEAGNLSRGPPSEAWARSLRQETALQDRYRRAIHYVEGGVENVGFDRWNAAQCLQEQVDAARGVEHTRRLAKSRGITARFTRRSMMKDFQGTELQTTMGKPDIQTSQPGGGISDDDASLTRDQALERFGIDLSRVGVMTSARTASRQALTPGEGCNKFGNNIGDEREADATNAGGGIGRRKEDKSVSRTGGGRGLGKNMTSPTGDNRISRKEAAARRQEVISEKLKVLDVLLSDEIPRPLPAEENVENKEEVAKASAQQDESVASKESGATALSIKGAPSHENLAKIGANLREELQPKTRKEELVAEPEPRHTPHEESGGGGPVVDALEATTLDMARANEVEDTDQPHLCGGGKALPYHRPCWWWASLLPPDVEDICIPDTVFSAPTRLSSRCNNTAAPEAEVAPDQTSHRQAASVSQHRAKGLLWAFSKAEVIVSDEVNSESDTRTMSRGGLLAVEDKDSRGGTIPLSPSVETRGRRAKIGLSTQRRPLKQRPPVQHRLHTRAIDGKDGLLCAARAICKCGRRGGGGGGGGGWTGGEGSVDGSDGARRGGESKLKLPLALLKIWGHESEEERGRKSQGGNCRGRRLTVVSLWTETEVFEALRDMARGRWCRPHLRGNANTRASCAHTDQTKPTGGGEITSPVPRRGERPAQTFEHFSGDEDACCVQAFTKSGSYSADRREHEPRGGVEKLRSNDGGEHGRFRRERGPATVVVEAAEGACLDGPVFYRAAWRKTGKRLFVWKIRSRYPYVSNVSAHFCPLVRVGSAAPFTATEVEEGVVATAATKMEKLATVFRKAYDPTLQRLWADWAVHEDDGQWYLVEVHGVKTEADLRNAAAAKAVPIAFAEVESKVSRSTRRIPPKHICDDPDELKARISAAGPTQELSFVEPSKKMIAIAQSKRHPSRPPTPSMVAESTKKALLARREGASDRKKLVPKGGGGGARRMLNQYWRCAGDFCETHPGGQRQASADATGHKKGNRDNKVETTALAAFQPSERDRGRPVRNRCLEGGAEKSSAGVRGGGGDGRDGTECEEDDIVGRRKHALSVETPRTVLFRLVLNARAALLRWRPSAAEFSMMEKPVQLCSVCYTVCSTIERERIETTRRAMDAEEEATKAGKARRNRKPPGWKSRVQHELEESLSADRRVVSNLIDSFEAAAAIAMAAAAPNGEKIKRVSSSSSSKVCRENNYQHVRKNGEGRGDRGGRGGSVVTWADRYPVAEIHLLEESEGDACGESMLAKAGRAFRSAHSTPRRKAAGAGRTSLGQSERRSKTAPMAPSSGLTMPPVVQQERDEETPPAVVGLDAKRTHNRKEDQRQVQQGLTKLQVRARRKAKERARRRVRIKATDGAARNEPSGKQGDDMISAEDDGRAGSTPDDQTKVYLDQFPPLLQPTAPTALLWGGAEPGEDTPAGRIEDPDGRGGEDGSDVKRFGRGTGSFCNDVKTSCEGAAIINGSEISSRGSGDPCIVYSVKQSQHVLEPTAPAVNWRQEGEQEQIEKVEAQGTERVRVARDGENSDYGEEEFEKDFEADEFEEAPGGKGGSSGETPGCTTEVVVGDNASSEYGEEEFEEEAA